jgi:hypothetical protein
VPEVGPFLRQSNRTRILLKLRIAAKLNLIFALLAAAA